MALQRYTRTADGTIPVPALLYDDEELLASQENTGIYDGYVQVYLSFTHCSKYSSLLDYLVFLTCNPFKTSINNSAYRNHQTTRLVQSMYQPIAYSTSMPAIGSLIHSQWTCYI